MDRFRVVAPERLCIYEAELREKTYNFIANLNRVSVKSGYPILVDLSQVVEITAAASVLLFATTNTAQLWYNNINQITFKFPTESDNKIGYRLIVKTGLARALRAGSEDKLNELIEKNAYFQSSTNPAEHRLHTVEMLTSRKNFHKDRLSFLSTGISEAMLNVSHHAYKDPTTNIVRIDERKVDIVDKIGERWWQCAWFDSSDDRWVFIICDLGISIPGSYKKAEYTTSKAHIHLKEAFSLGNSRYQGLGRGNGSEDMKRMVENSGIYDESILVYSGGAEYYYDSSMSEPTSTWLPKFFQGTLIEWTLHAGDYDDDKN